MSTPPEPPEPGRQEDVPPDPPSDGGGPDVHDGDDGAAPTGQAGEQPTGQAGEQPSEQAGEQKDAAGAQGETPGPARRTWVLPAIVVAVLVVAAGIFFATRESGDDPEPTADPATEQTSEESAEPTGEQDAEQTTDASPEESPTAEDEREVAGGNLEARVDETVIAPESETTFELADGWSEHADGMDAGARQAIEGVYTDGDRELTITAAAFETIEEHDAYAEELVTQLESEGAEVSDEGPANAATGTGYSWVLETGEDPADTTVVWRTDDGVVLSLSGPRDAVELVFRNMSI